VNQNKEKERKLTYTLAHKHFFYSYETGNLYWKLPTSTCILPGALATSKLSKQPYLRCHIFGYDYLAHRVIWLMMSGKWPVDTIDHLDNNGANNKLINLSPASDYDQMLNRKDNNKVPGVHFSKKISKWHAHINVSGRRYGSPFVLDWFEAVCARKSFEARRHEL